MSHLFATAGTKLFIGDAKAFNGVDFTETDFTSGTPVWTEIGGTTNLGSAGDSSELISSQLVSENRVRKMKGPRNAGSMQIVANFDSADAGQIALLAAEATSYTYAFKVQLNDAPEGGTPSIRYFVALVLSTQEQLNQANNVVELHATIEIDSNIVRVAAASA